MFTFCFSLLFRIWMAEPSNARRPEHDRPFLSISDFKGRVVAGAGGRKNRLLSSHAPSGGNQGKPTENSHPVSHASSPFQKCAVQDVQTSKSFLAPGFRQTRVPERDLSYFWWPLGPDPHPRTDPRLGASPFLQSDYQLMTMILWKVPRST